MSFCKIPSLLSLAICGLVVACGTSELAIANESNYVPAAPDYSDAAMWHIELNDMGDGADVFYIPSTWEFDWTTTDGRICHYADPSIPKHHYDVEIEMKGVADYMADGNNFYSPHYRHITLDSWATLRARSLKFRGRRGGDFLRNALLCPWLQGNARRCCGISVDKTRSGC